MGWEKVDSFAGSSGSGNGFYRLETGDNRVRIISEPEPLGKHWIQGEQKFYICKGTESCNYCNAGNKPGVRFLFYVIDRKDGQVKVAEFGYSVVSQLRAFQKEGEYAFDSVPPYDVNIKKSGEKKDTEYTVIPARQNTDLSPEEFAMSFMTATEKPLADIIEAMKAKVPGNDSGAVKVA